jgi:hypothetical protein
MRRATHEGSHKDRPADVADGSPVAISVIDHHHPFAARPRLYWSLRRIRRRGFDQQKFLSA